MQNYVQTLWSVLIKILEVTSGNGECSELLFFKKVKKRNEVRYINIFKLVTFKAGYENLSHICSPLSDLIY